MAALCGAVVGGLIGFLSSWGLQMLSSAADCRALREQVVSLMRLLEGRMIGMINHDKWFRGQGWEIADLLVARVFSKEGTNALVGVKSDGDSFFSVSTEIQRNVVGVRNVIERLDELLVAVRGGDFYQSGEQRFDDLFRELRSYAEEARRLLQAGRTALGDSSVIADPIANEPPSRRSERAKAEQTKGSEASPSS